MLEIRYLLQINVILCFIRDISCERPSLLHWQITSPFMKRCKVGHKSGEKTARTNTLFLKKKNLDILKISQKKKTIKLWQFTYLDVSYLDTSSLVFLLLEDIEQR